MLKQSSVRKGGYNFMNPIEINKFSELHDGKNIFFCKTDNILEEFENIKKLKNDVIFISGNSDYCIADQEVSQAPPNIKKWFCQNRLSDSELLQSIPLGLDNSTPCKRGQKHGTVWGHAPQRLSILNEADKKRKETDFIYANFSIETNPKHRLEMADVCNNLEYINTDIVKTHEESNRRDYSLYVEEILKHQAVLCPIGNNMGDNHRIYESLYLGKVSITFNPILHKYLHHLYPTILIKDLNELKDYDKLEERIKENKKAIDFKYLDMEYWRNLILNYV